MMIKKLLNHEAIFIETCLINGKQVKSKSGQTIPVTNPFDNKVIANVPKLENSEIDEAIEAAFQAFQSWKKESPQKRSQILRKWFDLLLENAEDLAKIMVLEQGKPLREAIGEIKYAASYVEFYAEEAKRIYGDVLPSPFPKSRVFVVKEPVGVVGIITPWNFPAAMMVRKMAPALATGCTCVIKPDERTPLTAFAVCELARRAGFPDGVVNVITGVPNEIGKRLTGSSLVRKISFTGSTEVGKQLMRQAAENVQRITLELGGNAPFIVFDDADIKQAVEGLIIAKFRNTGQTCVCANRIFIQESVQEDFIKLLREKVAELSIGNGMENKDIVPLIDKNAVCKLENLLNEAKTCGAKIFLGGKKSDLGGTFFEPTIISDVNSDMKIFQTELFGPVITIISFRDEQEVIDLANDTKYGLASYFYAKDSSRIWRVAEKLEYGMVGVNTGVISSAHIPFGGIKESGFGREGSRYGLEDYLNLKYICLVDG
jgi:succinate-semialdehyde dehydrogenase/glutarate-semialdehyde dehydrogenase